LRLPYGTGTGIGQGTAYAARFRTAASLQQQRWYFVRGAGDYLPRSGGVSILRVLHAAQDWWNLL
jgi:hypothetical protein